MSGHNKNTRASNDQSSPAPVRISIFSSRRGSSSSNPKAAANKSKAKKPKAKKLTYAELEAELAAQKAKSDAKVAELTDKNAKLAEEKEKSDAKVAELATEKAKSDAKAAKLTTEKEVAERLLPVTDFLGSLTGPYLGTPNIREGRKDGVYFAPSRVKHVPFSMLFVNRDKTNQLKLRKIKRGYADIINARLFGKTKSSRGKLVGVRSEADVAERAAAVTTACNEEILIPDVVSRGQQLATFREQRAGTTQGTRRSSKKRDSTGTTVPTAGLRPDVVHVQFPGLDLVPDLDLDSDMDIDPDMDLDPQYRMVGEYKLILQLCDARRNKKGKIVERVPVDVASMYNDIENGDGVRCAVNQIYSYMVVLELRYAYLCTYNTWWFMKRTRDTKVTKSKKTGTRREKETGEETLYISEPFCVDSVGDSAATAAAPAAAAPAAPTAAEKFSLCEAYCYFALSAINDESAVGYTAASKILKLVIDTYPGFPNNDTLKEDLDKLQTSVREACAPLPPPPPGTTTAADLQALVVLVQKLPLIELPREPEYIEEVARGRAGTVFKGRVEDVPFEVMIKITDLIRTPELRDEMKLEYQCYCRMVPLWGTVVPFCIWAGSMPNFRVGLVTSIAGEMGLDEWVLNKKHNVEYDTLANSLRQGLAKIHARGVAHGDVTARNIMIDDDGSGKIMFVDFGCSTLLKPDGSNAAEFEAEKQEDLERLNNVLILVRQHTSEEPLPPSPARKRISLRIA